MRVVRMMGAKSLREANSRANATGALHSAARANRQSNASSPTLATPNET